MRAAQRQQKDRGRCQLREHLVPRWLEHNLGLSRDGVSLSVFVVCGGLDECRPAVGKDGGTYSAGAQGKALFKLWCVGYVNCPHVDEHDRGVGRRKDFTSVLGMILWQIPELVSGPGVVFLVCMG